MHLRIVPPDIVKKEVRDYIFSFGTAKEAAKHIGMLHSSLHKLTSGHRRPANWLLNVLNMKRVNLFFDKDGRILTENQMRQKLREIVSLVGVSRFAREVGVTEQFVYLVRRGLEPVSEKLAKHCGYTREEMTIRVRRPCPTPHVSTQPKPTYYQPRKDHKVCY